MRASYFTKAVVPAALVIAASFILALNLERAGASGNGTPATPEIDHPDSQRVLMIEAANSNSLAGGCTEIPLNQAAWYRAENNVNDTDGFFTGTLQNGATFSASGQVGSAFSLANGASVFTPKIALGDSYTVEMWINPNATQGQTTRIFASHAGLPGFGSFEITSGFALQYRQLGAIRASTAAGIVAANTWSHVAVTRSGADDLTRIYLNGALVATSAAFAARYDNTGVIGGADQDSSGSNFSGRIDEVSLYNRDLTAAELESIVLAGSAGKCDPPFKALPRARTLFTNGQLAFSTSGSATPVTFSILQNGTGGSIDPTTGAYTAGPSVGTDIIRATAGGGLIADAAAVTISPVCVSGQKTWDGGGTTNNWSEVANWTCDQVPATSDVVVFNSLTSKNSVIDIPFTVRALKIEQGYKGTITQSANFTLAGNSSQTTEQNDGTFICAGPAIEFQSTPFIINGGTFNCSASNFTISGASNFFINGGSFIAPAGTLTLNAGLFVTGGTFNANGGTVIFTGNQQVEITRLGNTINFNNLTLNTSQWTIPAFPVVHTAVVEGTFNYNSGTVNAGTVETRGDVNIAATAAGGSGTIAITGDAPRTITIPSGAVLPNLALNSPNVQLGTSGTGNINVRGMSVTQGTLDTGNAAFEIGFNFGVQSYTQSGGSVVCGGGPVTTVSLSFTMSGGAFDCSASPTFISQDGFLQMTINGGTFTAPSQTMRWNNPANSGSLSVGSGGTFLHPTGTLDFRPNGFSLTNNNPNVSFNDIIVNVGNVLNGAGTVRVNNVQVLTGGIQAGSFEVRGNLDIAAAVTATNGANYTFSGTNSQTLLNASGRPFTGTFTVNKPSGTLTLLSDLVMAGSQFTPFALTQGTITTGNFKVDASINDVTRVNGHIIGTLRRTFTNFTPNSSRLFPVGTANGYSPVTANITTLSTNPSSLTISAVQGSHPNMNSAFSLGRFWAITEEGAVTATLTFNYVDGDVVGDEAGYRVHRIAGNTLQILQSPTATIDTTANTATVTGITDFSDWSLGVPSPALQISPPSQIAAPGTQINFSASGGYPPYTFALVTNNSGASFDPGTRVYTAGQTLGTQDTVRVTDFFGNVSNSVITVDLVPTQLAFIVQPTNRTAGQTFDPALQVVVRDANGNTVTNATNPVTIAIGTNPAGGTLAGTVTRAPVNGIATFDDLSISKRAIGYRLSASSPGLASATSSLFNVSGGAPVSVAFATQPSNVQAFETFTPAPVVEVRDAFGNPCDCSPTVTIAFEQNPGNAQLIGPSVSSFPTGVHVFGNLRIDQEGTGYRLRATVAGLTPAISEPFTVSRPSPLVVNAFFGQGGADNFCTIENCTFFEAASAANTMRGHDVLHFNLPGDAPYLVTQDGPQNFAPDVTIDATTQPGFQGQPIIELRGNPTAPVLAYSLRFFGDNVVVRGLRIKDRFQTGISLAAGVNNAVIEGNHIGLNTAGNQAVGMAYGIRLEDADNNIIGGELPTSRNVIVAATGILVNGQSSGNQIKGNYIGTDVTGTMALNSSAASNVGIDIFGSSNTIGGTAPGAVNLISGNSTGIAINSPGNANTVIGNLIGPNAAGTGNVGYLSQNGISIRTSNNVVGGTELGAGNTFAFNGIRAVAITNGVGNSVRGNRFFSNQANAAIDLNGNIGITPNDPGDVDTGGNDLQNFPDLTSAESDGVAATTVNGTLSSRPNQSYTLDFYSNPSCDASGYGEGETYRGTTSINTDGSGIVAFAVALPAAIPSGHVMTATATDAAGNTSEFSVCRVVTASSTISGRVFANGLPLANTEVRMTGGQTASALTDADGNYTFENVPNGLSYTLTPVKPGYTFTPASRTINPLTSDQTGQDFAFTLVGFRLSGSVMAISGGVQFPLGNVGMTLMGAANRSFTTKAAGTYFFSGLPPGSYTLTYDLAGYTFTPPAANIEITTSDISQNLTAQTELAGLDGRIAFESTGSFVSNADGSGEATLNTSWRNPAFNRDGTRVAFNRTVNVTINGTTFKLNHIFTANADGSNAVQLATASGNWNDEQPAWSPDGQRIAFRRITGAGSRLMLFSLQTAAETTLDATANQVRNPSWSFNGGNIVYHRTRFGDTRIAAVPAAGGPPVDGPGASLDSSPAASHVDDRIAFISNAAASSSISVFGSTGVSNTNLPEKAFDVAWSPDGTRLAVSGQTTGKLYFIDAATGTVLSSLGNRIRRTLSWAPDPTAETPAGSDVDIAVGSVGLTFAGVSTAGTTTVRSIPPSSAGTAPSGFQLGTLAFEITTTAVVSPPITVCFTVPTSAASTQTKFNALTILHNEGGVLVDRTVSRDFATRQICAEVTSLSPFVLAEQVSQALPSITGLVRDANGDPLTGVEVNLFGTEELTMQTDQDGIFSFVNLTSGGNYIVQPKQVGYLFSEYSETFVGVTGDETAVFVGTPGSFSITGRTVTASGTGMVGIEVELDGNASGFAVTDTDGRFTFTGLPADGFYSIRPLGSGSVFAPNDATVEPLLGDADVGEFVKLAPTAAPVSISGRVMTSDGQAVGRVRLTLTDTDGNVRTVLTSPFGYYVFEGVTGGRSYVLEASSKRYVFPESPRLITALQDVTDADFIGVVARE